MNDSKDLNGTIKKPVGTTKAAVDTLDDTNKQHTIEQ